MSEVGLATLLRDTIVPRDRFRIAVLIAVTLRSPAIWLTSCLGRGEPLAVTALYRPGGDIQYFELVASLSRGELGESNLLELAGTGVHPFPLASIALHATLFAVLGAVGLLVADALATLAFTIALTFLGRILELPARLAAAFAGLVATTAYVVLWPLTDRLGWGKDLLWGDRFPRPSVSEIFFVLALCAAAGLAMRIEARRRWTFWVGAGVALSLCLQSDIYSAFIVGLVMASAWAYALATVPSRRRELVAGAAMTAAALGATAWPFVLQRSSTPVEILRRWGAYPLPRSVALGWIREVPLAGPLLFALVAAAVVLLMKREAPRRVLAFWALAVAVAALAMPVFFGILGQGIYPYMFPDRLRRVALYGALFVALAATSKLHAGRAGSSLGQRLTRWAPAAVLVAMVAMIGLRSVDNARRTTHTRRNWYDFGAIAPYRPAFVELTRELEKSRGRGRVVLGTFDQQVHIQWQMFGGRRAFVPDAFVSIAPDAAVERRFALFGKAIGMSEESWLDLVKTSSFNTMFLAVSKYTANRAWKMAPADEYTTEQLQAIERRGIFEAFDAELPRSELERLRALYAATDAPDGADPRLDAIVLTNDPRFAALAPDPARFALVFENAIFRLYERR